MHTLLRNLYPQYSFRGHDFGGPDWAKRTMFDIVAVVPGNPPREVLDDMARALLRLEGRSEARRALVIDRVVMPSPD